MILSEEHLGLARFVLFRMVGRKRAADPDLIQASYLGLCKAAERFDESKGASFTTYAWYKISGAIKDEIAHQCKFQWDEIDLRGMATLPNYGDIFLWDRMVQRLSEEEKLILNLYFGEDLTLAKIGDILGVSKSWASRKLQRALERLRRLIADESQEKD